MEPKTEDLMFLRKRMVLPEQSTKILKDWLRDHLDHPFPTKAEKQRLREMALVSKKQLKYWFTNARRRIVPRMKRESRELSPRASSAPDMNVTSSSSDDAFADDYHEETVHTMSAASSRNLSVDSAHTSSSSGHRHPSTQATGMHATSSLSLRRGSTSVPDLSSSCSSQLTALLAQRTPSGRPLYDQRPAIPASQPALAQRVPSLAAGASDDSVRTVTPLLPAPARVDTGFTSPSAGSSTPLGGVLAVTSVSTAIRHPVPVTSIPSHPTILLVPSGASPLGSVPVSMPYPATSPYESTLLQAQTSGHTSAGAPAAPAA
eukprot:scpid45585/ scgid2450/ Homeobox protein 9